MSVRVYRTLFCTQKQDKCSNVKVEVAVLGSPSLAVLAVSVEVRQHWTWTRQALRTHLFNSYFLSPKLWHSSIQSCISHAFYTHARAHRHTRARAHTHTRKETTKMARACVWIAFHVWRLVPFKSEWFKVYCWVPSQPSVLRWNWENVYQWLPQCKCLSMTSTASDQLCWCFRAEGCLLLLFSTVGFCFTRILIMICFIYSPPSSPSWLVLLLLFFLLLLLFSLLLLLLFLILLFLLRLLFVLFFFFFVCAPSPPPFSSSSFSPRDDSVTRDVKNQEVTPLFFFFFSF